MNVWIRQGVIVALAFASSVVAALSTFLTWFHVVWFAGSGPLEITNLTAYQSLGVSRNPVGPFLMMIGAGFAFLAGAVAMHLHRLDRYKGWTSPLLLTTVVLESVGAIIMRGPLFQGPFHGSASRGPGEVVCLVGAALALVALLTALTRRQPESMTSTESKVGEEASQYPPSF